MESWIKLPKLRGISVLSAMIGYRMEKKLKPTTSYPSNKVAPIGLTTLSTFTKLAINKHTGKIQVKGLK